MQALFLLGVGIIDLILVAQFAYARRGEVN